MISFPRFFKHVDFHGNTLPLNSAAGRVVNESGDCAQCSVFASVSCNALVLQNHFDTVLDAWNTRRPNAQVVLERNGMGSEECEEVREKLLDLKTRYLCY